MNKNIHIPTYRRITLLLIMLPLLMSITVLKTGMLYSDANHSLPNQVWDCDNGDDSACLADIDNDSKEKILITLYLSLNTKHKKTQATREFAPKDDAEFCVHLFYADSSPPNC